MARPVVSLASRLIPVHHGCTPRPDPDEALVCPCLNVVVVFFNQHIFFKFILREHTRMCEWEWERGREIEREREREGIPSRLRTCSAESSAGLKLMNREIMT